MRQEGHTNCQSMLSQKHIKTRSCYCQPGFACMLFVGHIEKHNNKISFEDATEYIGVLMPCTCIFMPAEEQFVRGAEKKQFPLQLSSCHSGTSK